VAAVVAYWGRVRGLIKALKYDGETRHAAYLGHVLFQHVDRHVDRSQVDLVLTNPTFVYRGVRHTELLIEAMAQADRTGRWSFDDPSRPALIKSRSTVRAHGQDQRGRLVAAEALGRSIQVARPELIASQRLVVIDDVGTTGSQLKVLAGILQAHGAREVHAVVLAASSLPTPAVADRAVEASGPPAGASLRRLDALRQSAGPDVPRASL
jgi:predicted amidophosphoribosyltransferase